MHKQTALTLALMRAPIMLLLPHELFVHLSICTHSHHRLDKQWNWCFVAAAWRLAKTDLKLCCQPTWPMITLWMLALQHWTCLLCHSFITTAVSSLVVLLHEGQCLAIYLFLVHMLAHQWHRRSDRCGWSAHACTCTLVSAGSHACTCMLQLLSCCCHVL